MKLALYEVDPPDEQLRGLNIESNAGYRPSPVLELSRESFDKVHFLLKHNLINRILKLKGGTSARGIRSMSQNSLDQRGRDARCKLRSKTADPRRLVYGGNVGANWTWTGFQ